MCIHYEDHDTRCGSAVLRNSSPTYHPLFDHSHLIRLLFSFASHALLIRISSVSHSHLIRSYPLLIRFSFTSTPHPFLIRISGVQRLRNPAYGHELCGLMIMVPYAAWTGYENATEQARGMIVKYIGYHGGTFEIKFGPEVGSAPLKGVSWAQLFGEAPVVRDVMLTLQIPSGSTSALFAKPSFRPLASADCWDMRLGKWVKCTGEVVNAQTRQQRNQTSSQTRQQHRVSDAVRNAERR